MGGFVVTLVDADGHSQTMTTDASGHYSFGGLAPGTVTVSSPASTVDAVSDTPSSLSVAVPVGTDVTGNDFGYLPRAVNYLPGPGIGGTADGFAFFIPDAAHLADVAAFGFSLSPHATIGTADLFTLAPGLYAYSGVLPHFPELGPVNGFVLLLRTLLPEDKWTGKTITNLAATLNPSGPTANLSSDSYTFRFQFNLPITGPGTAYSLQYGGPLGSVHLVGRASLPSTFIGIEDVLPSVFVGGSLSPAIPLGMPASDGVVPAGWMARAIGEFTVNARPGSVDVFIAGSYQNICGDLTVFDITPDITIGQ
jgi:hypothetical protein